MRFFLPAFCTNHHLNFSYPTAVHCFRRHLPNSVVILPIHIPPGHLKPEGEVSEYCENKGTHEGGAHWEGEWEKHAWSALLGSVMKTEHTKQFNSARWRKVSKKRWEKEWYGQDMKNSFLIRSIQRKFPWASDQPQAATAGTTAGHVWVSRGVTSP